MKIALFTDTYHPATNGIVFVIDILHKNLTALGHDVTIVAPRPGLRNRFSPKVPGKKIIWIPAFEALFDENLISLYFPPRVMRKLSALNFEAIVIFTPAQTGLLGAYIAKRDHLPLIEQYSTDLIEYIKHYPAVMPAVLALVASAPFALKMNIWQLGSVTKKLFTPRSKNLSWSQKTVSAVLTGFHNSCDLVVCVSEKNVRQLRKQGVKIPIACLPTGVDKLPVAKTGRQRFMQKYGLTGSDFVILYLGRLGAEKNLDMLIDAYKQVAARHKNSRLLMVGDFEHREHLENKVRLNHLGDSVIFTGRLPRTQLGNVYNSADIFVFPSLTDTQGLVLNEAAHSGLPIIWCDKYVNQVAKDGFNAILVRNRPKDLALAIEALMANPEKRLALSRNARLIARQFSEAKMTAKFARAIKEQIAKKRL